MEIKEHNVETGEIIIREATKKELDQALKLAKELDAQRIAKIEAAAAKTALLIKLGITEEEAKLLLS